MKRYLILAVLVLSVAVSAFSADFIDGRIRLVLNPNNGRFSLFYMSDIAREEFVPLFASQDPRTSFLSLIVNSRTYKLGDSSSFKTSIGGTSSNPSLIFESSFIVVTESFSFVKTGSSSITNGVIITITITNKSEQTVEAGLRLLLDTDLGEKTSAHFSTNLGAINGETIIGFPSAEKYWVSKNDKLTLVGSLNYRNQQDTVYFANWKRLNDAPWKIPVLQGRNFSLLPYSINDSAVCYYYEPAPVPKGGSRTVSIALYSIAPGEENDFTITGVNAGSGQSAAEEKPAQENPKADNDLADSIKADLITLQIFVSRLDECILYGVYISDEELASMNLLIFRIKSKYSIP